MVLIHRNTVLISVSRRRKSAVLPQPKGVLYAQYTVLLYLFGELLLFRACSVVSLYNKHGRRRRISKSSTPLTASSRRRRQAAHRGRPPQFNSQTLNNHLKNHQNKRRTTPKPPPTEMHAHSTSTDGGSADATTEGELARPGRGQRRRPCCEGQFLLGWLSHCTLAPHRRALCLCRSGGLSGCPSCTRASKRR